MSNGPLRIEQYETVRYDLNCNPLGVPDSVTRAIMENISAVGRYRFLCLLCARAFGAWQRQL